MDNEQMSVAFLYNMGLSYLNGDGVARDPETEFGYFTFGFLFFLLGFVFYGIILSTPDSFCPKTPAQIDP